MTVAPASSDTDAGSAARAAVAPASESAATVARTVCRSSSRTNVTSTVLAGAHEADFVAQVG